MGEDNRTWQEFLDNQDNLDQPFLPDFHKEEHIPHLEIPQATRRKKEVHSFELDP